jgi:hypothetical protein
MANKAPAPESAKDCGFAAYLENLETPSSGEDVDPLLRCMDELARRSSSAGTLDLVIQRLDAIEETLRRLAGGAPAEA